MTIRWVRPLSEAWLILVLAAVFGASLAAVHSGLSPRIEANKRAETLRQLPALVVGPDAIGGAAVDVVDERVRVEAVGGRLEFSVSERELAGHRVLAVSDPGTAEILGWVIHGTGQGYADAIELLVAIDPTGAVITGLYVLSQKETPALGDGITRQEFRGRFVGKSTSKPLEVTQTVDSGGRILALTAATISSQSVCDIVNRAIADVRPSLAAARLELEAPGRGELEAR